MFENYYCNLQKIIDYHYYITYNTIVIEVKKGPEKTKIIKF